MKINLFRSAVALAALGANYGAGYGVAARETKLMRVNTEAEVGATPVVSSSTPGAAVVAASASSGEFYCSMKKKMFDRSGCHSRIKTHHHFMFSFNFK